MPSSTDKSKNTKIMENIRLFSGWFKTKSFWGLFFAFLAGALTSLLVLTLKCPGNASSPALTPDTSSLITHDSLGNPDLPDLPENAGSAEPTLDTLFKIKYVPFINPKWRIQVIDYTDGALKIAAIRPVEDAPDSYHHEVYSGTWYAPGNFRVLVDGKRFIVDTFPIPESPQVKKKWYGVAGLLELDSQDGLGLGAEGWLWDRRLRLQLILGVGRAYHELNGQGFPANQNAPLARARLQISLP